MSVRSGFWNSVGTDIRTYYNSDFSHLISLLIKDGIHQNYGNCFIVIPGTGLQVIVQTGEAWFNERWIRNDSDLQINLNAAPSVAGFSRIDTIAIKVNGTTGVQLGTIEYVTGTAGTEPSAPTLTDTDDIHWYKIADIAIATNQTSIIAANITNYVGTTNTPFITGILETVDITQLMNQWSSRISQWFSSEQTSFTSWRNEQAALFNTWFNQMKDQLDSDAAGHLQNEIDALTAKVVAEPVTADRFELFNTFEGGALAHTIYGMSEQDGTPTPTSPVDIVSAEANFKCVGKNLIAYPYYQSSGTGNGITFTVNADGTITVNGTATASAFFNLTVSSIPVETHWPVLKAGTYKISDGTDDTNVRMRIQLDNASGTHYRNQTFTIDSDKYYKIYIYIPSGSTVNNVVVKPMLTLADANQTYEPYHEYTADTDLELRAIEVSSTDDYNLVHGGKYYVADTIEWSEDEGYKLIRRIASVDLGNYTYGYQPNNTYFSTSFANVKKSPYTKIIEACEGFVPSTSNMAQMPMNCVRLLAENSNAFNFKYDGTTDPTAFKTLVTGMKLQYIMETPTVTALTNAQAKALLGLQTYNGATLIESTADVLSVVKLEYGRTQNEAFAISGHNIAKSNKYNVDELSEEKVPILLAENVWYGTCSTGAGTQQKDVTTIHSGFTLATGAKVSVLFTTANTHTTPTLKVGNTAAKSIKAYGTTTPTSWWKAGDVVTFIYDGTNYIMQPSSGQVKDLIDAASNVTVGGAKVNTLNFTLSNGVLAITTS